jgi:ketosteroid isomerase-like protein
MQKKDPFVRVLFVLFVIGYLLAASAEYVFAQDAKAQQAIATQIIAREKASAEAWQKKDKAFFMDFYTDDATYFGPMSPYLESNPKENFLPKLDKMFEMFKMEEFQMYNPRVQVYGDTAILTYNSFVMANFAGQPMNYTGKMTVIYVKQNGIWKVAHGHESMNPQGK